MTTTAKTDALSEAPKPGEREATLPILTFYAFLVGLVAALGAIGFKFLIALIYNFSFYGIISPELEPNKYGDPSVWGAGIILVPVIGGLIVVWIVQTFAPEAKGHGVPEVMYAIYHQGGNVRGIVAVTFTLKAAREMTLDLKISDETFAILRETLDEERLTDLVITISFYNGVVRFLATMEIDVEPEYQKYLDEFPLPAGKA